MMLGKYDAHISFGKCALKDGTACTNILDINKADPARLAVNVIVTTAATGGTSITVKLQGCDTQGGTYKDISVSPVIPVAELTAGKNISLPIPSGAEYKFMRVSVVKEGTFTAGEIEAAIDSYIGA